MHPSLTRVPRSIKTCAQKLVQSSEDRQHRWSVSELMHAVVLLAHVHSLASFAFGCGVLSEIDHPDGHSYTDGVDDDEEEEYLNEEKNEDYAYLQVRVDAFDGARCFQCAIVPQSVDTSLLFVTELLDDASYVDRIGLILRL
jgi:hypothetical protein